MTPDAAAAAPGPSERRVASNTAVQVAGKAVVVLIGLGSIAVLTRYLGAEGYGKFSLALTYVQAFGVLADIGLFTIVVRELARRPERAEQLVGNALTVRAVLSVVVIALAASISLLLPYEPDVRVAIVIAGVPFLLGLLNTSLVAIFQARLQMGFAVVSETAGRAAAFAAAVAVAALDLGFYAVLGAAAVGALVALAITWRFARRVTTVRFRADPAVIRELVRASLPLGLALALNEIYFRVDTLIISLSRSIEEVGLYALAYRVLELAAAFPAVFLASVFPVLSRYVADGDQRVRPTVQAASDVFVLVGVPLAAGGLVLAPAVVELAAGSDFADSATPLRILMFAAALSFVNGLFGYCLIAADRQARALWLNATALVVNVVLNILLVPTYGIDAAAAVTVFSELVVLAGCFVLMRRYLGLFPSFATLPRVLLAAVVMAAVLWPLREGPVLALLPLGVLLYAGLATALGAVDRAALRRLGIGR